MADNDLFRLEPVIAVRTTNEGEPNIHHWEVLCSHLPVDLDGWRCFYRHLEQACQAIDESIRFAINVDCDQVIDDVIWQSIKNIVEHSHCFALEWTERKIEQDSDFEIVARRLLEIKATQGVEVHLDDVGSGDDPMVRASIIRPDIIKIDGELFHRARNSRSAFDVIKNHIACYADMFTESVIEWVETEEDLKLAESLGANYVQGHYFRGLK